MENIRDKIEAFVAQWLEHWSSKPGVESSIVSEGKNGYQVFNFINFA